MDQTLDCFFADPDEPEMPNRSPSRLDFCMEDSDGSPTQEVDWTCTSFRDDCSYTTIAEDAFSVDIAPLKLPHLLFADSSQVADLCNNVDISMAQAPPERPAKQVIIEPQAPKPLRLPSVQVQDDGQECAQPPRCASQRLNYPHHGFSRSALLQQKLFWNSRHEEWVEWQSRVEQGEAQSERSMAYTGIATTQPTPPYMRTPPSGLERDSGKHPHRNHEQGIHSSIYPRVGDISALRDPYSMNIDRCFFRYPLWTLHKTLYEFHMNQRSAPPPAPSASQVQLSTSWSTLSSYTSSTADDEESDSTLVADDGPVPNFQHHSEPLKSSPPLHDTLSQSCLRRWGLSWYARWELLIDLLQHDRVQYDTIDESIIMEALRMSKQATSPPPIRLFRLILAEDDSGDDDDDDEDYGTLLSHTRLSAELDEECERALAFYCRESKRSGTAL